MEKIVFCILKINDERSQIRIHESEIRIRGSGSRSAPKCYGSPTLVETMSLLIAQFGFYFIVLVLSLWLDMLFPRLFIATNPKLLFGNHFEMRISV
jgi:hypothetical protein